MQHRHGSSRGRGGRLVLAAVALTLLGLLSMHGWGSHAGSHPMEPTAAEVVAAGTVHAAPDGHAGGAGDRGDMGGMGGAMGLCLAVLSVLLLGLALVRLGRGVPVPGWLLPSWRSVVLVRRDPDPPDLVRLCVSRC